MFWKSWQSKPQPVRRHRSTTLRVEQLEPRTVPAVARLDTAFNGTGSVLLGFGGPGEIAWGAAMAVQADGKIVVAGTLKPYGDARSDFAVARLNADGSFDATFGSGGKVLIDFAYPADDETASCLAIQNDGKIVIGGTANTGTDKDFVAARLTTAGVLDTTFGNAGKVKVDFARGGTKDDICNGMTTQIVNGLRKIVLVGSAANRTSPYSSFAAARINDDGSPDTSFNTIGNMTGQTSIDSAANAVAIDPSNRIVLVGFTTSASTTVTRRNPALLRVTADGYPDASFAGGFNGMFVGEQSFGLGVDAKATAIAFQPDGKFVFSGGAYSGELGYFFVVRFDDNRADRTFNASSKHQSDGLQVVTFGNSDLATSLAIQADGKIVVGGYSRVGVSTGTNLSDFAVVRLTPQGAPDPTFDNDGKATFDLGESWPEEMHGLAIDDKGRIVFAGFSYYASNGIPLSSFRFAVARLATDSVSTVGAFDPTTGMWYERNQNSSGEPDIPPFAYGAPGWQGFVGDWDGNGSFTPGVYDPATGKFYLRNSNTPGPPDIDGFAFGPVGPTVKAVVGDWNGDGYWTIGTFDSSNGVWYLRNSNSVGPPDAGNIAYGAPGWQPIVGDWDGNGTTTVGVFDLAGNWYLRNSNSVGSPNYEPFAFGLGSWKPVVGDWDGNGTITVGVFDTNGTWYLRNANSSGVPDIVPFTFGLGNWTPVAGDLSPQTVDSSRFVSHLYEDVLGRAPDQIGLSYWVTLLDGGILSRGQVGIYFDTSNEYRTNTIRSYFQAQLGRAANDAEIPYFMNRLAAGETQDSLRVTFFGSEEFFNRYGRDNAAFVVQLYSQVLGRTATVAEVSYWMGVLNQTGGNRTFVATQFLFSGEYQQWQVWAAYSTLLKRAPDGVGFTYWVYERSIGMTVETMTATFLATNEYFLRT